MDGVSSAIRAARETRGKDLDIQKAHIEQTLAKLEELKELKELKES